MSTPSRRTPSYPEDSSFRPATPALSMSAYSPPSTPSLSARDPESPVPARARAHEYGSSSYASSSYSSADADADADETAAAAERIGTRGVLGTGYHSTVYLKTYPDGSRYALKSAHSPHDLDLLHHEYMILSTLHASKTMDGMIRAHALIHAGLALEWADLGDAWEYVRTRGPLEKRVWLGVAWKLVRAVEGLRKRGCVHGDIKPHNVLLFSSSSSSSTEDSQYPEPKLGDFASARMPGVGVGVEGEGLVEGVLTPAYAAPELLTSSTPPSTSSDIFSLGLTLLALATGREPYQGRSKWESVGWAARGEWWRGVGVEGLELGDVVREVVGGMCARGPGERMGLEEVRVRLEKEMEVDVKG
ncbi:hypothetical protein YB2330_005938 [Saitoella coloradoensis]